MARLRRFLMLERARGEEAGPSGSPEVSNRFEALGAAEEAPEQAPDPFAPPPDPVVSLEVDMPAPAEPRRDPALSAEIAAMTAAQEQRGVAAVEPHHERQIDRLAALVAVGPLARWSPRARARLVVGLGVAVIGGLSFFAGIGPRLLQGTLALLLFALFIRS